MHELHSTLQLHYQGGTNELLNYWTAIPASATSLQGCTSSSNGHMPELEIFELKLSEFYHALQPRTSKCSVLDHLFF